MAFQGIRRGYIALSSNADPSLKNLIEEEKDCVNSMRKLSKEIGEASNYMLKWGDEEHFDLKDLSTHFSRFSKDTEKAIVDLSDSYSDYRKKLKEILKMTCELKELQKKHASSAEKLKKHNKSGKGPDNKLEKEEEDSNMAVLEFIANYECEKRKMLQEGLNIQFKGWEMFSNRIGVISHFGLHMANQIPQGKLGPGDVLPPYTGADTTKQIHKDYTTACEGFTDKTLSLRRPSSRNSNASLNVSSFNPSLSSSRNSLKSPRESLVSLHPSSATDDPRYQRRQSTPSQPINELPYNPPQISPTRSRTSQSARPTALKEDYKPTKPRESNSLNISRTNSNETGSNTAVVTMTCCAFCENSVDVFRMKEHLDSGCQDF